MLILSQDKKSIVNFNNKEDIFLEEDYYEGKFQGIKIISIGKMGTFLGIYDTEERAKGVLQDIIKTYKFNINFKYNKFLTEKEVIEMQNDLVYEMPEK